MYAMTHAYGQECNLEQDLMGWLLEALEECERCLHHDKNRLSC